MPAAKPYLLERKKGLYLKMTKTKGRGLFCLTDIRAGEELEATPTLILHEKEHKFAEKTILRDYVFSVDGISKKLRDRLKVLKTEEASGVIMGIASFCNHDENPNAEVLWEERGGSLYHVLRASRKIPKGTEICTSYGEGWFDGRDIMSNPYS